MSGSFPDHLIASAIGADYSVSEYDSAEYPSGLRERIANPSVVGSNPTSAFGWIGFKTVWGIRMPDQPPYAHVFPNFLTYGVRFQGIM